MGNCTVPSFLKAWFDKHFAEECEGHDLRYVLRDMPKTMADFIVSWRIGRKYKWSAPIGIGAFIVLITFPRAYKIWYKDELGIWRW